jgi:serine acetyltransferase
LSSWNIVSGRAQVGVVGDNVTITGGVTFGGRPTDDDTEATQVPVIGDNVTIPGGIHFTRDAGEI